MLAPRARKETVMRGNRAGKVFYFLSTDYSGKVTPSAWHPNMDVYEAAEAWIVVLEVPGVRIEDLEVVQHEDRIIVKGARHAGTCREVRRCHQMEIACGPFVREIRLPSHLRGAAMEASLALGILSLRIVKQPATDVGGIYKVKIEAE